MTRIKMVVLLAVITWYCNDLKVASLSAVGNFFIASFSDPPPNRAAFVFNDSLVNITEGKPNSEGKCGTIVKASYNPSLFPQVVYNVQCKNATRDLCEQAYKRVHMLLKRECEENICSYDVITDNLQTACIPSEADIPSQNQNDLSNLTHVLDFFGDEAENDGLERVAPDEANFFNYCQWDWVANVDENRFPKIFERAVCKDYKRCTPVFKEIVMFAKRSDIACIDGYCNYEPHIYNEPVACISKTPLDRSGNVTN